MQRWGRLLGAVIGFSMVLATAGGAAAQNSGASENRADFIYQLDRALGIEPVYPATPNFADVPASSPYYGYIEAAFEDGITNGIVPGIFGPSFPITRAEAAKYLVIAFGAGSAAQGILTTRFTDNKDIPTALVGYVAEAAALGLMHGFPNGSFAPEQNLTVAQEVHLISQLLAARSTLRLTVTPSATDVAPGQLVTLSATSDQGGSTIPVSDATYSVIGSNSAGALISGSTFVGSLPGNYTVQALSGTATATTTISVYGAPTALRIIAPTQVVANDASTAVVQVDVVDANGNIVRGSTDTVQLESGNGIGTPPVAGFAVSSGLSALNTASAFGGVATFTLTAGQVAGAEETLTASDTTDTSVVAGTATITGTAQTPTAISVHAASFYLTANGSDGTDALFATVLDQTGNPMLSGAYTVSFGVTSGPANFAGQATAAGVYYGPTQSPATATLDDVQGSLGPVIVTASGQGLIASTVYVTAVVAGLPTQIALSSTNPTASADGYATYIATIEDSHGFPVDFGSKSSPETVQVSDSDTSGTASFPSSLTFTGQSSQTFRVYDTVAGAYMLTASDASAALTSGTTVFTVTAGPVAAAEISPVNPEKSIFPSFGDSWLNVPASSASFPVSLQLTDDHGNKVAEGGVAVQFYLGADTGGPFSSKSGNIGTAILSSSSGSISSASGAKNAWYGPVTAYTDAQGIATANVAAEPYAGDVYQVKADVQSLTKTFETAYINLRDNVASGAASVQVTDPSSGAQVYSLVAGRSYDVSVQLRDQYGNDAAQQVPHLQDYVDVAFRGTATLSASGKAVLGSSSDNTQYLLNTTATGSISFQIVAMQAGPLTMTVTDFDVYNPTPALVALAVTPGTNVAQVGFSSNGTAISANSPLSVTAGDVYPITVMPEDAGGNPIVAPSTIPVQLKSPPSGEYRLGAPNASDEPGTTRYVDIPAGQMGTTFYYVPKSSGEVSFTAAPIAYEISTPGVIGENAPNAAVPIAFTFKDAGGNPLPDVAVTFSLSTPNGDGSLSTATGITNSLGQVMVTFTTPAGWSSGDSNNIMVQVQGVSSSGRMQQSATVHTT